VGSSTEGWGRCAAGACYSCFGMPNISDSSARDGRDGVPPAGCLPLPHLVLRLTLLNAAANAALAGASRFPWSVSSAAGERRPWRLNFWGTGDATCTERGRR
jgi:hypothetical protein